MGVHSTSEDKKLLPREFQKNFTLSPAINLLEGLDILHLKGGIHSPVYNTKTFLYDIMESRYKQNNMWFYISRILSNEQYNVLRYDMKHPKLKGTSLGMFLKFKPISVQHTVATI